MYDRSMVRRSRRDVRSAQKPFAQDPRPSRSVEPWTSAHGPFATQHFGNGVNWPDTQLNSRERPPTRGSPALLGTDHAIERWHGDGHGARGHVRRRLPEHDQRDGVDHPGNGAPLRAWVAFLLLPCERGSNSHTVVVTRPRLSLAL